jgi:hypothetical protein
LAGRRARQLTGRFAAAAFAWLAIAGSSAWGAVTIGQVASGPFSNVSCPAGDYLQPSVTGGPLYIAKQAGRITSWSTVSSGPGTYAFKVFRRTSDPDAFQVVAHASETALSSGLETFPVDVQVRSGDMIGFHKQGAGNGSCAIGATGDAVLQAPGDLADGASGGFAPIVDRRLNLSANLVPSNEFQVTGLSRNSRQGTVTMAVQVPNPGIFTLSGKALRKGHVSRSLVGAGSITFLLAPAGKSRRTLLRKGAVRVPVSLTFAPTNGDPLAQTVGVKFRVKRAKPAV